MLKLLKFEIGEMAYRKGVLRTFLICQITLVTLLFTLPSKDLLPAVLILTMVPSIVILYALEMTKAFGTIQGYDKRKLLIAFPITRKEYAFRTVILYTGYIFAQAALVVVALIISTIWKPDTLTYIPELALGVFVGLGVIFGIILILTFITGTTLKDIIISTIGVMSILFYGGFLLGFAFESGNLPGLWSYVSSSVIYCLGIFITLVVTPRRD